MKLFTRFRRRGGLTVDRPRDRINVYIDTGLHGKLLEIAGQSGVSMTAVVEAALSLSVPILQCNPEFISTLADKLLQSAKEDK